MSNNIIKISYQDAARLMKSQHPNVLGEAVFLRESDPKGTAGVGGATEQGADAVTAIMANPSLVASVNILSEDDSFTLSRVAVNGGGQAVFVAPGDKGYIASRIMTVGEASATLFNRVDTGALALGAGISYEMGKTDFFTLLAAADLYTRKRMLAMLGNTEADMLLSSAELAYIIKTELEHGDPRWLLSFVNDTISCPGEIANEAAVTESLRRLASAGLVKNTLDSLTDNGMVFAVSLYRRLCLFGIILAGARDDGSVARQRSVFLRGDRLIWFADEAGDTGKITLVTTGNDEAADLLREYLRPEGQPREYTASPAAGTANRGAPQNAPYAEPVKQPVKNFCPNCGTPVKPSARFCQECGRKI